MKPYKIALLIILIASPLLTLFAFDYRYNAVENGLCNKYKEYRDLCDYPERHEKHFLLNTNFYRHLGTFVGRDEGTSLAFITNVREIEISGHVPNTSYYSYSEAEKTLGHFNFGFFAGMAISIAISASAFTCYACSNFKEPNKVNPRTSSYKPT